MAYEFRFPDLGEGVTEGELLAWKVKEGDVVAEDQTLAELETDKAVVELPSPRAGRVARLNAAEGGIIKVGDVVVTIEEGAATAQPEAQTPPSAAVSTPGTVPRPVPAATPGPDGAPIGPPGASARPAAPTEALAEAEPYTGSVVGRLEEAPEEGPVEAEAPRTVATPPAPSATPPVPQAMPPGAAAASISAAESTVLAMPSVRALARELGVDLAAIRGTGPSGRILKQDVEDVAEAAAYGIKVSVSQEPGIGQAPAAEAAAVPSQARGEAAAPPAAPPPGTGPLAAAPAAEATAPPPGEGAAPAPTTTGLPSPPPLMGGVIEKDRFGPIERVAFRGIRRTMAKRMAEAVAKQAQVTTMDEADVTVIRHIREKERSVTEQRGVSLTYLAFAVKACTAALKRFPRLNAILEESGDEFVLRRYYNIGIAIDTKDGLVVPNIKSADQKSIFAIAEEIVDLVRRADGRSLNLQDLHGGTFTISNYGAIGATFATPVINYPEVALLGMGRGRELPVVRDGEVTTRLMLPLSLTIDHRLIDGAEATRFLNVVIGYLEDPDLLLLEGD